MQGSLLARPGTSGLPGPAALACLVLAMGATVAAALVGNGSVALALLPAGLAVALVLVSRLPLRVPLLGLFVLAWALEAPGDGFSTGLVQTPWRQVGAVLWGKLNGVVAVPQLVMTGFDFVAALLLAVVAIRHARRSTVDRTADFHDAPRVLSSFCWITLAAIGFMAAHGLATGGSMRFVLWQCTRWMYLPVVYVLMREGLRGPADLPALGRCLLGVGLFRAGEVILFRRLHPSFDELQYATTHADSVLFATCVSVLAATLLELPTRTSVRRALLLGPVFLLAMRDNARRLVWFEVVLVLAAFWLMTPWRPMKRVAARLLVAMALPLALYVAVGWSSGSSVFGPVRKVRSILDSKVNMSTLWRDWENYDLITTYREAPILGRGFGHPFTEFIKLPDVTAVYELEPYIPHNSVLGLWAFGGLVGFAALWMVFPVAFLVTVRAYRWSRTPEERVASLGAAAAQVCYVAQGYGDLGFGAWGPLFTLCTAWAVAGKICVANGGWHVPTRPGPVDATSDPRH